MMDELIIKKRMPGFYMERAVRNGGFNMKFRHFHENYEFYFLLAGEGNYFIDRETYRVSGGMAVMIKKNQIHRTSMEEKASSDRILVNLDERLLKEICTDAGMMPVWEWVRGSYGVNKLPDHEWQEIKGVLMQTLTELDEKPEFYDAAVKLNMARVLLLLYRFRENAREFGENRKVDTPKYRKVHEIAEYLRLHGETGESLEELAERFFISKAYMTRIFREVTGFTVNEYKNVMRVNKAKALLQNSSLSMKEIAAKLDFSDVTYFERVFKKHTDTTPLKYRKAKRREIDLMGNH